MSLINSLHVVPSRDHVVMALACISQFSIQNAEILYFGGDNLEDYFHSLASDMGVKFVNLSEAENRFYDELYVQTWFAGIETPSIISKFKFSRFFLYSEGHGNSFYSLLVPTEKLSGLVFLGFEMRETAFTDNLSSKLPLRNRIIADSAITKIYTKLFHDFSAYSPKECLNERDLLIISRYWGMPTKYPFAKSIDVEYEIAEELCQAKEISRVVIRSDSRYKLQNSIDLLKLKNILTSRGMLVIDWSEIFPSIPNFQYINNPEAIFRHFPQNPGKIFAFDGTFNIVAGYLGLGNRIIWASTKLVETVLDTDRSKKLVLEHIAWMKHYVSWLEDAENRNKEYYYAVSGNNSFSILAEFHVGELLEVNSELRDKRKLLELGISQERDVLTQERDVLTQERDAIRNSRIWRSTIILRTSITKLRQFR